jgi:hypothetical protein
MEKRLAEYTHGCLDALGIVNGPSHAEVMWLDNEDAPCLVEVGARPHGSVSRTKSVAVAKKHTDIHTTMCMAANGGVDAHVPFPIPHSPLKILTTTL